MIMKKASEEQRKILGMDIDDFTNIVRTYILEVNRCLLMKRDSGTLNELDKAVFCMFMRCFGNLMELDKIICGISKPNSNLDEEFKEAEKYLDDVLKMILSKIENEEILNNLNKKSDNIN